MTLCTRSLIPGDEEDQSRDHGDGDAGVMMATTETAAATEARDEEVKDSEMGKQQQSSSETGPR